MEHSRNRIAFYRDRCTPPLTQSQLAQALHKHINTIYLWEKQGAPSPADLLRLTELFVERGAIADYETAVRFWNISGRDAFPEPPELHGLFQAAKHVPAGEWPLDTPAPFVPLPVRSRMPLRRNLLFVGRADALDALEASLAAPNAVTVICGLGGIGKTQLACEFVHRYGARFPGGVFWLSFAAPEAVAAEIATCGGEGYLSLRPDFDTLPLERQVRVAQAAWREAVPRLLVFDNCEDEALLAAWCPTSGGCRVLVTSRRARWNAALVTRVLALPPLQRSESIVLLRRYQATVLGATELLAGVTSQSELSAIAGALGDLPLALHLAGSYLAQPFLDTDVAGYLDQLRSAPLQHLSLQSSACSPTRYDQNLAQTFAVSYERLRPAMPLDLLAMRLLARAARFSAGVPLPQALLAATVADDPARTSGATPEEALARLVGDLGLLELGTGSTLRMHPLVAQFIRSYHDDSSSEAAVERAVLAEMHQLNENRLPMPMLALQNHLRTVTDAALRRADVQAAELSAVLGWQFVLLSAMDEAQRYLEQALAIRERLLGEQHPATADSLGLLGLLHQFQGALTAARPYHERALTICERTLGQQHPDTGTCQNNLGYLLVHLGMFDTAEHHLRKALTIHRHNFGLKSAYTARVLNNLGYALLRCGEHAAARRYLLLALRIREQVAPGNNPATAQTLNNLGEVYHAQGKYAAARHYHERALAMRNAVFGHGHSHATESMRHIGLLLIAQGEYEAARSQLDQALEQCIASIGEQHIETAWKLDTLGELWFSQDEYSTARGYFERALAVYRASLPTEHRDVLRVQARLAAIQQRGVQPA